MGLWKGREGIEPFCFLGERPEDLAEVERGKKAKSLQCSASHCPPKRPWHYGSLFSEKGSIVRPAQVPERRSGSVLDLSVLLSRRTSFW